MNRKGFTLIELIVAIALLGVILSIAFVSINGVIQKSKIKECETLEGNIKSASKEYVTDNRYNNDFINTTDQSINFTISTLVEKKYLRGPVYDPFNKDKTLENTNITVSLNNNYTVNSVKIEGLECNKK